MILDTDKYNNRACVNCVYHTTLGTTGPDMCSRNVLDVLVFDPVEGIQEGQTGRLLPCRAERARPCGMNDDEPGEYCGASAIYYQPKKENNT